MDMDTKNMSEKKPYTPPDLIEYGDLVDITRTGSVVENDFNPLGSIPEG
jgi:hypothetical protein